MLVKTNKNTLTKSKTHKGLKIKHVMLLDTGDGSFTDANIKVKPHTSNPALLVFKCVSKKRLLEAMKSAGLTSLTKITKGSKHWIACIGAQDFGLALASGNHGFALPTTNTKLIGS